MDLETAISINRRISKAADGELWCVCSLGRLRIDQSNKVNNSDDGEAAERLQLKHNAPSSDPSRKRNPEPVALRPPPSAFNTTRINQIPARQQPAGGWRWASGPRQQSQSATRPQTSNQSSGNRKPPGSSAGEGWPTADLWRPLLVSRRPNDFTPSSSGGWPKRNGSLIHQVTGPRFPSVRIRPARLFLPPILSPFGASFCPSAISIASNHPFVSSW